jgi:hypothetical protein
MSDRAYVERSALTRSPIPPATPAGATTARPMLGLDVPGDPGAGSTKAGDGLNTTNLLVVVVSIWANASQTITGGATQTLDCWGWNPDEFTRNGGVAGWGRVQEADLLVQWTGPGSTTARNCMVFSPLRNPARYGARLIWVPNGITVSAGTDILLRIDGFAGYFAS